MDLPEPVVDGSGVEQQVEDGVEVVDHSRQDDLPPLKGVTLSLLAVATG